MKYLLFSHGFGVKKDSRGMFTDIASAFPEYRPVMFDYNLIDPETNEVIVGPYSEQAILLKEQISQIHAADPSASITLVGHSQGCIIPCLVSDVKIDKAVLLAPPKMVGSNQRRNKESSAGPDGSIRIPRKDGTTTIISKAFVDELGKTNPPKLYRNLAKRLPTSIIIANQDEILSDGNLSELSDVAEVIKIDGDHNFTGQYRKGLLEALSKIL